MDRSSGVKFSGAATLALCLLPALSTAAEFAPPESSLSQLDHNVQRILLSACQGNDTVGKAAFFMTDLSTKPVDASITPKIGMSALECGARALGPGGKGDFTLCGQQPGAMHVLGTWVYLPADANVNTVGIQVVDGEGEYLAHTVPANWTGWKWVEVDVQKQGQLEPTPGQNGKNGHFDQPLKGASVIWFSKKAGPSSIVVNGLVAAADLPQTNAPTLTMQWAGGYTMEPNGPFTSMVVLTNSSAQNAAGTIEVSIQQDSTLRAPAAPDPVWGTDHALGARSWTVADDKTIEQGSLTDGDLTTAAGTNYIGNHWAEAYQYIDLGAVRPVSHIRHSSGDANWCWKVDIAGSADGKQYTPVPGLQGIDWHAKWGANQDLDVPAPFSARFVRFRYHDDGRRHEVIRMPSSISIYDGLDDEKMPIPSVGTVVASGKGQIDVPAHSFLVVPLAATLKAQPGAYFVAVRLQGEKSPQLLLRDAFVLPPAIKVDASSRFGMNAADISLADMNCRLGVGWIRFENAKWPFVSPAPGEYAFDGSVAPWHVNIDEIIAKYRSCGMSFLPTMFMTPGYLATEKAPTKEPSCYPPKDLSAYGEFTFQTVARYASSKHFAAELKTQDRKTGLGLVETYELWNEPDMTNMDWGSWRGPYEKYLDMFRFGAEGVKRADPKATISSCGLSDYRLATGDKFRTYKYADGKTPLDFMDILNVHHYTGRVAPEIATMDINVDRADDAKKGKYTYERELQILDDWRKKYKPGMPVWMTEMGYDTGGPVAVPERTQAAFIVRNAMIALANGIDKVFLFRESGSGSNLFAASGVVRDDHSYKPSWFTLATLIRQLDGVTGSGKRLLAADRNIWLYEWHRGNETILTAWSISGSGQLPLALGTCVVTDAFGRSERKTVDGVLNLSDFPTYISGITDPAVLKGLHAESLHQEQIDRDKIAHLAQLKAYLFDFGSLEYVGTIEIGAERRFTPVLAKDPWNPGKGYGFDPADGQSEVGGGSHENALECDWVRLGASTRFRFSAKPGRYRLRLSVAPLVPGVTATLSGVKGKPAVLAIDSDAAPAECDVEVGSEPLVLQFSNYALLRCLTLVEVDQ